MYYDHQPILQHMHRSYPVLHSVKTHLVMLFSLFSLFLRVSSLGLYLS